MPQQTVIAEGVRLIGRLYSDTDVVLDGQVEGDVECPKLVVGAHGRINGNVSGQSITVNGEINGDIKAAKVVLQERSRISGDVCSRSIAMEHGAVFHGSSKPVTPSAREQTRQPPTATTSRTDDLTRIKGIGPVLKERLRALGVTTFQQIVNFTQADIDRVNEVLDFPGRIEREHWVEQAKAIAHDCSINRPLFPVRRVDRTS